MNISINIDFANFDDFNSFDCEMDKIRIMANELNLVSIEGKIDYEPDVPFDSVHLLMEDSDGIKMLITGTYDPDVETLDCSVIFSDDKVAMVDNVFNFNYHPFGSMGGLSVKIFENHIKELKKFRDNFVTLSKE